MTFSKNKKIEILLLLLIFLTPLIFTFRATNYNIPKIAAIEIFAFLIFGLWFMFGGFGKRFHIVNSPLNLPVLLYLLWIAVSAVWAANKFEALEAILFQAALACAAFAAINNIRNVRIFMAAMAASGSIVSVCGILQYCGIDFTGQQSTPLASTLGNINFTGEYLAMVIPMSVVMIFSPGKKLSKAVYSAISILMLTHLLLTKARGAWLGLATAGLIMLFTSPVKKQLLRFLLCILIFMSAALYIIHISSDGREISAIKKEVVSGIDPRQETILFRLLAWKSTFKMIEKNPAIGVGAGNFKITYPVYRSPEEWHVSGIGTRVEMAHNDYLQIASELGLIGLGIFIWMLTVLFRVLKILLRTRSILAAGLLGGLVSLTVSAVFEFPFYNPATSLGFWMILGMAGAMLAKEPCAGKPLLQPKRGVLLVVAVMLIACGPVYAVRVLASDFHLQKVRIYQNMKLWDKVIYECERSIHDYFPNMKAHIYLARALLKKNEPEKAFVELKTVLRLNPNEPWAYMCLGNIYLRFGCMDEAISCLKKAVGLNQAYLTNLGIAYLKNGMREKAMECFKKAVALKWDNELTYTYMGIACERNGEMDKAAAMYRKALEIDPDYKDASMKLQTIMDRIETFR